MISRYFSQRFLLFPKDGVRRPLDPPFLNAGRSIFLTDVGLQSSIGPCCTTTMFSIRSDSFKVRDGQEMRDSLRTKALRICDEKIARKGETVGLSFYAFFANKNDDPDLLMEAAHWWIKTHELDHFEKAVKIRQMILTGL